MEASAGSGFMATLSELNLLPAEKARLELSRCCGSTRWVEGMLGERPFPDEAHMFDAARKLWQALSREDWLEAFSHHPQIGEKMLRDKFAATHEWAHGEQAGVAGAADKIIKALAGANRLYQAKFGYIFIVCATGKTAEQMLVHLNDRLAHEPEAELRIAADEQAKITKIRLEKLLK